MKLADVKEDLTNKENYKPVSILSNLLIVFVRCLYNQFSVFFDKMLSKYQCGFRESFNAQHCLINLLEQGRRSLEQGLVFGAFLTDFSKALNVSHNLLVAKIIAYGLETHLWLLNK